MLNRRFWSINVKAVCFESLPLLPNQQIKDFHVKILEKGSKLSKTPKDMISRFVNGLPDKLAFFVRARSITTLKEALTSAKLGETYRYRQQNTSVTAASNNTEMMDSKVKDLSDRISRSEVPR